MKVAIVGSSVLTNPPYKARFEEILDRELTGLGADTILLPPNRKFNLFVKEIGLRRQIQTTIMTPSRPSWIGPVAQSVRKDKARQLHAEFIVNQADHILFVESEEDRPGVAYRKFIEVAKRKGVPITKFRMSR